MDKHRRLADLICTFLDGAERHRAGLDAEARARGMALPQLLAAGLAECLNESFEFRPRRVPLSPPRTPG